MDRIRSLGSLYPSTSASRLSTVIRPNWIRVVARRAIAHLARPGVFPGSRLPGGGRAAARRAGQPTDRLFTRPTVRPPAPGPRRRRGNRPRHEAVRANRRRRPVGRLRASVDVSRRHAAHRRMPSSGAHECVHVLNRTGRQPDTTTHRDPATRLLHAVRSAQRGGADRVRHYATLALSVIPRAPKGGQATRT